jgi:capsule polysaccharide export protein KpsE/RkpR
MQKYVVIVRGENLLAEVESARQRLGFFTNVSVEAFTAADAEERAIDIIREDAKIRELALNAKDDPLRFVVEEVHEVEAFDPGAQHPRSGLAFFPEESADNK